VSALAAERSDPDQHRIKNQRQAGSSLRFLFLVDAVRFLSSDHALLFSQVERDPVLKTAQFVTWRNSTVYRLRDDQAKSLEQLWSA
jgi:hypothetical protein